MIEIKFRAIQAGTNEFIFGFPCAVYPENDIDSMQVKRHGIEYIRTDTLGQFTGLKDKNGVEIFEGDILTVKEAGTNIIATNRLVVEYSEEYCAYNLLPFLMCKESDEYTKYDFYVVMNIHQNKDLLNEQ